MLLDQLSAPIVLAPMAGGPSTPALAAAVCETGGLGSLAAGYLTPPALEARIAETRRLTARPFLVNVFVPSSVEGDPGRVAAYAELLADEAHRLGVELGIPRHDDDGWPEKLALLERQRVAAVSFTFGCPSDELVERLHAVGSEVWVTVTDPGEATAAAGAGADVLVVQGAEAGGHQGSFVDRDEAPIGLLALLAVVGGTVDRPLVAAGGITTGRALAAALSGGASAGQPGTAFLRCPEAGTSDVHRRALSGSSPTTLTRAFSGRTARGIGNRFSAAYGDLAPAAYPEIHHLTAPLRQAARAAGDAESVNLWAGQAYSLALELPAAEVVNRLVADAGRAVAWTSRALGTNR